MSSIIEANSIIKKIIGAQECNKQIEYRLSVFSVATEHNGKYTIYNTLTKELKFISEEIYNIIANNKTFQYLEELSSLIEKWFLVPLDFNDNLFCDSTMSVAKLLTKPNEIVQYNILPTTDCNARCFYCFELACKRIFMNEKTAEDIADYILKKSKYEKVLIRWFGGEPLYNSKVIDIISNKLIFHNKEFASRMTTNGYLFDEEIIEKARNEWHLKYVQITLDGTEEIYNKIKAYIYKDCASPFKKVYKNIGLLLDAGIEVVIRLNVDEHNISNIYTLIEMLADDYGGNPLFSIYPEMLFDDVGAFSHKRTDCEYQSLNDEFYKLIQSLNDKKLLRVFPLKNHIKVFSCIADDDRAVQILPNGKINKCEHYIDSDFIGDIYNGIENPELIDKWKVKKPGLDKCKKCLHYPNCFDLKECPVRGRSVCDEYAVRLKHIKLINKIKKTIDLT